MEGITTFLLVETLHLSLFAISAVEISDPKLAFILPEILYQSFLARLVVLVLA